MFRVGGKHCVLDVRIKVKKSGIEFTISATSLEKLYDSLLNTLSHLYDLNIICASDVPNVVLLKNQDRRSTVSQKLADKIVSDILNKGECNLNLSKVEISIEFRPVFWEKC